MVSKRWKLSHLTAFSHAQEHLRVQTIHGAIVTIIGVCVALVLFISEVQQCMVVKRVQDMRVDTSRREELHVSFNVTFPALPCEALLMDAGDVSGKWQTESRMKVAKNGEVHKHSVDISGRWLRLAEYTAPSEGEWDNPFEMNEIGAALKRHEGCNIHGWLEVQRVAGNVHFAVRPEALFLSMNAEAIMQLHPDASKLNISHANPLEGVAQIDRTATGIDKYFVKVVPTDFYTLWGRKTHTYQYSVTEYYHQFRGGEEQPPAVYLLYDASPIMVDIREMRPGLLRLLVRVCAVVGGAFALTGLFDKMVHRAVVAVKRHAV
ncbi:hypothetical protein CHLNCDRAFT_136126 [Chlorella variabilis]|uniref:Endoplasmic reticulum vesicle transporter C-terminal domain-containing protein n=1 Tax=Chlorella variabilis TaxID=554065 RepID=E1ZJT6_CHLVA|nr:hypothetical protein CHLNCDRAFT_136126 [Chlorella variabilis]EFN54050.1 hypothetical protein CHLNCDRAFT_136126 [Chlorella variabilis]|eukprot:XP_005846152.1 hypothetical protein CHLNCDRAFT_136126 [Chlorella variabilis]